MHLISKLGIQKRGCNVADQNRTSNLISVNFKVFTVADSKSDLKYSN